MLIGGAADDLIGVELHHDILELASVPLGLASKTKLTLRIWVYSYRFLRQSLKGQA